MPTSQSFFHHPEQVPFLGVGVGALPWSPLEDASPLGLCTAQSLTSFGTLLEHHLFREAFLMIPQKSNPHLTFLRAFFILPTLLNFHQ